MTKYQLVKLIDLAGGIDTRKRVQKIVYLLQAAGVNFEAEYFLHKYGPYSLDVARLTDELVSTGLLEESTSSNQVGLQFSYQLTDHARKQLEVFEGKFKSVSDELNRFADLAKDLAKEGVRELEVASTIAYYHYDKRQDWEKASQSACAFKRVNENSSFADRARALAKRIEPSR
jgi:uncharacterized protein YwgA